MTSLMSVLSRAGQTFSSISLGSFTWPQDPEFWTLAAAKVGTPSGWPSSLVLAWSELIPWLDTSSCRTSCSHRESELKLI